MAKKKRHQKVPEKKSSKNMVIAALALIAVIALIFVFSSGNSEPAEDEHLPAAGKYVKLNKPGTYEPGKVKITEFLKFNCGHCYSLNQLMPDLEKKYGDKIEVTYVPMLWRTMAADQAFRKSIEAYILARERGKDEEMKDALFKAVFADGKDVSSLIVLEDIGREVGLDDDFANALKNGSASDMAEANIRLGENFQVDETPTVIINGNLKVTPSISGGTIAEMMNNMDVIINSLLSQSV